MINWTDEKVKVLHLMYSKGHRAREIAKVIGGGCTANAVIGKATRLGIKHPHPQGKGRSASNDALERRGG